MLTVLYILLVFFLVLADGLFCGVGVCTRTQIHGLLVTASSVNHDSGTFQVEKVDGRRILRVRFQPRIQHALIPIAGAVWSSLI